MRRRFLLLALLLLSHSVLAAGFSGRVKLDAIGYDAGANSAEAALGYQHSSELDGQLRLNFNKQVQRWQFQAAWQLDARHGSAVAREHALATAYPALADTRTDTSYWDLDNTTTDSQNNFIRQHWDRLNLSYSRNAMVLRLGRQALTWGSGLVFHPMDLVNPFQPVATDTTYKRGTDMAYLQWLLASGSDIQFVAVPHKTRDTRDPNGDRPTTAVFATLVGDSLQWNLLLARDRGDSVFGIGTSGPWGGAVWNLELMPTYLARHATRTSALMNLSYASTLLERNITTFIEYYHNGFGEAGSEYTLAQLNADLLVRLRRGQLFVSGRNYVSAGASWEWTPLLQLSPTLIVNLQDHSSLFDLQLTRSLGNDTNFKAGLRLAIGGRGTEFGGLQTAAGSGLYLARSNQVFVRLESYF